VLGSHDAAWRPGVPDRVGAALALASLEAATALTVRGAAAGLVTGPVAKARLAEVGFAHPGQTEFVAAACGVPADDAVMMLAGPSLRTVPITVHVALAAVPGLISAALIERKGAIVVAALAREEGRMGDEDQRIVAPAVAALQARGIDASGPHSADALFAPHLRGTYDTVLCMYHDQALIPLKTLDFDSGINLTLGLPIVRTSPDHGTAFSLAGTRRASSGAMIAAIRLAGEIAARRAMK
jgi:4-hydroxythreonine-4-phosphate dehydrogenase